jgi:tripartite-type tricarboxylate transporter receptor subunit TctC
MRSKQDGMTPAWRGLATVAAVAAFLSTAGGARADAVTDFYKGKTVNLLIGAAPGGGFDIGGRLMARYMGKYIPGEPNIVPQNMQGAGGLRMANTLANTAPKDGTVFGIHVRGIIQQPMLDDPAAKFDPLAMTWIGTMSSAKNDTYLLVVHKDSGVRTYQDMRRKDKQVSLGSVGGVSTNVIFALVSPELFGFNTRLIKGYAGSAGVMLAVQRHEVDGSYIGLSSLVGAQAELLKSGDLIPVMQLARTERHPQFPTIPMGRELVSTPEDAQLLSFMESLFYVALPFSGPPGIPADRTQALRDAFMKANADPGYLAEAKKLNVDISPLDGETVTKIIAEMKATPASVIERYKKILAAAE